jgi:catechol 2,3-dioxygenase-like lactoylglutathione lyase family enzyme
MPITTVLAVISVSEPDESTHWYERLFGRPPDVKPMGSLAEWQITEDGWLQVYEDGERAGNSYLTLAVDDLDAQIAQLAEVDLVLEEIEAEPPMRLAQIRDPDDNLITFGQHLKGH